MPGSSDGARQRHWLAIALAAPHSPAPAAGERLARLAERLDGLGLAVPALAFAAAQRPLLHIYGQCLRFVAPCLGAPVEDWALMLEDPHSLDRFLERLEALLERRGTGG